ncbi:Putative myo-inosiltol transporter [Komagataella phaffii CBS 7435]|uniref:Myo-inositol transporter with strong similarity to the minor myo-inositol transporter Itr2p n=2 Tax=Komagataella phaffii TaxID=460519 RepID=C4R922_KOMPG|nr:Myo-inositol transporter with strong similarity to the minor myo-inositol transporter Itr2p [Komagataella phaffii GS115]AOA65193.1 GQ67_05220T0 [Komagataella phaffii]CAH2450493.1 Putative myo-inosiltol transporter [Komagataella phaffii CBS 7435]AOA70030.1 GQ68_05202T0 [Komagataella phaffii GS115]CAY72097.1 Myo-inositol transporter with strong similarity to the minor myo-inositol transporter Itr2p [Komagataella phaffii GS115]CCA40299.1 Putative myo-inosiltol transporter [Komagataella phaffii
MSNTKETGLFETGSTSSENEKQSISDNEIAESLDQQNILTQYSEEDVMSMGRNYAIKHGLDPDLFAKGAAIARNPIGYNRMEFLSQEEKEILYQEEHQKWKLPKKLYYLIIMASMGACVQGMDESVINGANLTYPAGLGIGSDSERDSWLQGLVNSAPYICCGLISCWMTDAWNARLGRKWTIFWTCFISAITCFWQGFCNTWYHLFIARFMLGFGIGPKSATIPVYAAECVPHKIRGALVMMWQMWTAFGIMLGYVFSLAFHKVPDHGIGGGGLAWRLMLGSAMLPAIVVCLQVWSCPESPRWLMGKERHAEAYESLKVLRNHPVQAARDTFYQNVLLMEENSYTSMGFFGKLKEMVVVRRNRNGAMGAGIVMFMQQFCGINVIAYYSSSIFVESGFTETSALLASWGFGMINWLFALPAVFTIDLAGRRTLLLITFPLMSMMLLLAGFSFWIPEENEKARVGVVSLGIYLFAAIYSSGEGPVPFTYSAECAPLYIRDVVMSFATATCWFFNSVLALTWPSLKNAFKVQGAFGFYAAWNIVGFFLVLMFLPETKGLTLEELDDVFDVPTWQHASYQLKKMWINIQRNIIRKDVEPMPPLYKHHRMALTNAQWEEKHEVELVENV